MACVVPLLPRERSSVAPSTVEYEDAYASADAADHVVYRSTDLPLTGAVAGYYLALEVEAIAPTGGVALAGEPALFSVDITFDDYINR